jgi:hypothetical protein
VNIWATDGTAAQVGRSVKVCADEAFISSAVVCYIISRETVCHDPATDITVPTGSTVQFYQLIKSSCTAAYSPALPAGACPATDPAYAFCR